MKKISVIVTAYNEEKYVLDALNSINNQTYNNIEIIFVDDGSTDLTLPIAKKFQETCRFPMIIISKENEGVAVSRNVGLKKVSGDYIKFLDADDFLEVNALESMVRVAELNSVNIVKTSYQTIRGPFKSKNSYNANKDKENDFIDLRVNKDWLILENMGIGDKLFRTDCWSNLEFPNIPGSFVPEDLAIMPLVLVKSRYIGVGPLNLLNYRRHAGSLTNTKTRVLSTYYIDSPKCYYNLEKLFKEHNLYHEYKDQLYKLELMCRELDALCLLAFSTKYPLKERIKIFRYLETLAFNELKRYQGCPSINENKYAWWWHLAVKLSNKIISLSNLHMDSKQVLEEAKISLLREKKK